ncbi:hypothetical protein QJS66_17145 [Kocuria rhizophila]|nr:hypothetical protein QJS66_17145 [Kocuria rhizophila]
MTTATTRDHLPARGQLPAAVYAHGQVDLANIRLRGTGLHVGHVPLLHVHATPCVPAAPVESEGATPPALASIHDGEPSWTSWAGARAADEGGHLLGGPGQVLGHLLRHGPATA